MQEKEKNEMIFFILSPKFVIKENATWIPYISQFISSFQLAAKIISTNSEGTKGRRVEKYQTKFLYWAIGWVIVG